MADTPSPPSTERLLVLAPLGRDSAIAEALFQEAGLRSQRCATLEELVGELASDAGAAVITQEAVQTADLHKLFAFLAEQPPWSDLPLIIITGRGGGPEKNPGAIRLMDALGNVTFLERPFRPSTLLSVAQSALRGRRRQYQARAHVAALEEREKALHDSEQRLRTLADNIPVLAWTADAEGAIFWYNSRWYEYTGATPERMLGWGWQSVHDPEVLPTVKSRWQAAIASGQRFEMVFPLRGADGAFRPFLTQVAPIFEHGRVARWFGTNVDISAQRDAEAAIRASEERLRALNETLEQQVADRTRRLRDNEARLRTIFETSFQLQGLLDVEGVLLDANATSLAVIGARLEDVVGMKFWQTPWFAGTPGASELLRDAVASAAKGENIRHEMRLDVPNGPRSYDFSIRPIRDEHGRVFAIVPEAADITLERRAEEALRQAQKMEAVGQLTGGIAHDFNNMLQAIASGVELMRRRIAAGRAEEALRYVDAATQSIERAAALTHRLLAFSRRQALAPRRVELDALIEGMAALMRQTVGPSVSLKLSLRNGAWPVRCDPNQLESALLNLAINARDAMAASGGQLLVATEHVSLTAADLAGWHGARPGEHVRISVSDTGTGMTPDVIEHAFEPFFTTKPVGQGTGLGLSQVFGFISQSSGLVRIESEAGHGATVRLYLPRDIDAADAEPPSAHAALPPKRLTSANVLLVEDEPDIRDLAADALREAGCTVIQAQDGPSGLNALRARLGVGVGAIDILVADVGLPGGLNGRQLADAARALSPTLPVLLITGYAGEALGPGVQLDQPMELLSKPFTLDALSARVEAMLATARAERPSA